MALSADDIAALAYKHRPIMRFAAEERFFPILAESWLSHATAAAWPGDPGALGEIRDNRRRGTGLMDWPDRFPGFLSAPRRLAGAPNEHDRPLQLSSDPGDVDAIGGYAARERTFLNFGGWNQRRISPEFVLGFAAGDADYDFRAFSELAAAMGSNNEWLAIDRETSAPAMWIPQPPTPTAYVEAQWAGRFSRISDALELGDLPPADRSLDGFLVLTYQFLYPIREPAPGGSEPSRLEGQWEAISIFFGGEATGDDLDDPDAPVTFELDGKGPRFVVFSRGLDRKSPNRHIAEVRPWDAKDFERVGDHVVAYVACGTHANRFSDTSWSSGEESPPGELLAAGDWGLDIWHFFQAMLVWAIIVVLASLALAALNPFTLALFVFLVPLAVIAVAIIALLVLIALILLVVISAIEEIEEATTPNSDYLTPQQQVDHTGDEGDPAAGPAPEGDDTVASAPAGGGDGAGGTAAYGPGTTNVGSSAGYNNADIDVRVISMLHRDPAIRTGYPPPGLTENPHWWDYSGAWGVRVDPDFAGDWRDGTRRVDAEGRSWAYHSAVWLVDFFSKDGNPGP
jgi:hypothetical protein